MPVERSAGMIVFRNTPQGRRYLLLSYPGSAQTGFWGFPKGRLEKGETAKAAARRELKEETGIVKIKLAPDFKEIIKYFVTHKKGIRASKALKFVVYFLAETKQKKVTISWEHEGYEWLSFADAHRRISFDNLKKLLKRAEKFRSAS